MSIVTMKKKTNTQYNNMSANKHGFSLNGGYRNQGYVGQTSLSRSLPRTLMKNNVPKGHGGCCGTYHIAPIVQSSLNYQNNPSVIKSSYQGNNGMLMSKYRWIRRPSPFATVKNVTSVIPSQSELTEQRRLTVIKNIANYVGNTPSADPTCKCNLPSGIKPREVFSCSKDTTVKKLFLSQSQHIENHLHNVCVENDQKPVSVVQRTPFGKNTNY